MAKPRGSTGNCLKNLNCFTKYQARRNYFTVSGGDDGLHRRADYTALMNINNTDHYLLAADDKESRRSATTLELASVTVVAISVIALSGFLI